MTEYLLIGLGLGFAAAVQPGPFIAYLITQTLTRGLRHTWHLAFAPLISDGPIIALALLVLSQMPDWLQRGLSFVSGAFILYLAWGAFQQWKNFSGMDAAQGKGDAAKQNIFKAVLMNAISPMPYIYWSLVTGPVLLGGWEQSPSYGISFLVAFYVTLIGGILGILAIFGAASNMGNRISRILLGISALALAAFGLLQLWRGLSG